MAQLLIAFALVATLIFGTGSVKALAEAIEDFTNHFRGGPPPPTHPIPSNDSSKLTYRT